MLRALASPDVLRQMRLRNSRNSCGEILLQTILREQSRTCSHVKSFSNYLDSAMISTPCFIPHFQEKLLEPPSIFLGLSTVPRSSSTTQCNLLNHRSREDTLPGVSMHSARSQVRGRLCGGAKTSTAEDAGVRVDSTTSGLSEP